MSYLERERSKAIKLRMSMFNDHSKKILPGKDKDLTLNNSKLNLYTGIRMDAINYFKRNKIKWHSGKTHKPTAHLLCSQVACVNHLYFLRHRKELATEVLRKIDHRIEEAVRIDEGYVEFEVNGKKNYLNEKSHNRGSKSTSIDALMIGRKNDGKNILVIIEWNYTEGFNTKSMYTKSKSNIYNKLLEDNNCPIKMGNHERLYYEPFYNLMRQTLLGWKMVEAKEYDVDEYVHVHVIPKRNFSLRRNITSPLLFGFNISEVWKNELKEPNKYIMISPYDLLDPIRTNNKIKYIISYLRRRYWN